MQMRTCLLVRLVIHQYVLLQVYRTIVLVVSFPGISHRLCPAALPATEARLGVLNEDVAKGTFSTFLLETYCSPL